MLIFELGEKIQQDLVDGIAPRPLRTREKPSVDCIPIDALQLEVRVQGIRRSPDRLEVAQLEAVGPITLLGSQADCEQRQHDDERDRTPSGHRDSFHYRLSARIGIR